MSEDLFGDYFHARKSDPDTSKESARRLNVSGRCLLIFNEYRKHPEGMTDEEVSNACGIKTGAWKRCSDLRRMGLIFDTGERKTASTGMKQMVCKASDSTINKTKGDKR